jgi:son of sevenless-like protein
MLRERPNQINFTKRQKAAEHIQQIQLYQSAPYNLAAVPSIAKFVEDALLTDMDEQVLYQMSLEVEPRERDDEKSELLLSLVFVVVDLTIMGGNSRAIIV